MLLIATPTGKVGHVVASVFDGSDGRVITTVCGKTYPESDISATDERDVCSSCDNTSDIEDEPKTESPKPKAETSKKK